MIEFRTYEGRLEFWLSRFDPFVSGQGAECTAVYYTTKRSERTRGKAWLAIGHDKHRNRPCEIEVYGWHDIYLLRAKGISVNGKNYNGPKKS